MNDPWYNLYKGTPQPPEENPMGPVPQPIQVGSDPWQALRQPRAAKAQGPESKEDYAKWQTELIEARIRDMQRPQTTRIKEVPADPLDIPFGDGHDSQYPLPYLQ